METSLGSGGAGLRSEGWTASPDYVRKVSIFGRIRKTHELRRGQNDNDIAAQEKLWGALTLFRASSALCGDRGDHGAQDGIQHKIMGRQ